jgi:hypothetical protein
VESSTALQPNAPGYQEDQRVEGLASGLCHMFPNGQPPVHHLHLRAWNQVLPAATSENLKPDLLREHTMNQQMIHDFRLLGAKRSRRPWHHRRPPTSSFFPGGPAKQKAAFVWGFGFPHFLGAEDGGLPQEHGFVCRGRTVSPQRVPAPNQLVFHLRVQDYLLQPLKTSTNCIITGMVLGPVTS